MKLELKKEHGNCPSCNADLDGGGIWEHFYKQFTEGSGYWIGEDGKYDGGHRLLEHFEAEEAADKVAIAYGATRTKGRWGRVTGIEFDKDRIEEWECPDCKHRWAR